MSKILDRVNYPKDLKKLNILEKQELAKEIRDYLLEIVSKNGGHLASNLGVVELTIAIHSVFDSPKDKIVWDVGHQAYVHKILTGRKEEMKEGSYTTYLFQKGLDKILKKVGEESTEVIIAAKAEDKAETIYEIADLAYHVMVLMIEAGISLEDIHKELGGRHVIDHKIKQEKMTQ